MAKGHINIPIFIPHEGCPNRCVFCNQHRISGKSSFDGGSLEAEREAVRKEISEVLATVSEGQEAEVAFFGGSFTGIGRERMCGLLDVAQEFVDGGRVDAIRLSTRPDYIDREILSLLAGYRVKTVELGIQSMEDRVLLAAGRGHTAADSERACRMVCEAGFSLVGQMMTGLPLSEPEDEKRTAEKICAMGASAARIYPTVVFPDTGLDAMARSGDYRPPTLEEAVARTAGALEAFADAGIPVLRIGLHSSESLTTPGSISFGAYHPAMGELVEGELYRRKIEAALKERLGTIRTGTVTVYLPTGELSKGIGQNGRNREWLLRSFSPARLLFRESPALEKYRVAVEIS